VEPGELLAVVGPSGSGKSTLLHLLGGLDRPTRGDVIVEGRPISGLDDGELALVRRRRFGFVLQFFNLLPTLDSVENAAFPLMLDGLPDARERAVEALRAVGLGHRLGHRPSQLSGGEQQRVALARALAARPAVLFADEPTGNLDSTAGEQVMRLLREAADAGQTIVMVTHDPRWAGYADGELALADGAVVAAPAAGRARP
jgi:putative ABC transport system ATP-binding protein